MTRDQNGSPTRHFSTADNNFTGWLEVLERSIDWQSFDRYFLWLQRSDFSFQHPPLKLFKSLLLRNWFSLSALEFNHEICDRKSFREFVGIDDDAGAPQHFEVVNFQSLLVSRSIATEVVEEFSRQIKSLESKVPENLLHGLYGLDAKPLSMFDQNTLWTNYMGPEWPVLEQRLSDFWRGSHQASKIPTSSQIKLSDLSDIADYLTLIRVVPEQGFRYELVGSAIDEANEGSLLGATINSKIKTNIDRHGEPGLQAELSALFQRTVQNRRPESLATWYLNAKFNKCHLLTAQVPVRAADDSDRIDFLLGISLIRHLTIS